MRFFSLLFLSCLFFALSSCAEDIENQAIPDDTIENDLSVVKDGIEQNLAFGLRSEVIRTSSSGLHHLQSFFLTVDDVKKGGTTQGLSTMVRISILRRSAKPATDFRFEIGDYPNAQNEPGNDEMTLVFVTGAESMNFTTGDKTNIFHPSDGVLLLKTDPVSGVQTIYLDARAPDGYRIKGTWEGNFQQVEFPFL